MSIVGKKKKKKILPDSVVSAILLILLILVEDTFIFVAMALDVFPAKYFIAMFVIMALFSFGIILLISSGTILRTKSIIGLILAVLLCDVMGIGIFYMLNTYKTLENISKYDAHFELYDVVVLKDGSYDDIDDITKKTVYIYENNSKAYFEAQEKLVTKSDVKYTSLLDSNAVANKLTDKTKKKNDSIIFIPDNNYQLLCENDKKIDKETESIFSIKVIKKRKDDASKVDVTQDPYNICITGIDMWGSINQVSRSDVNMIVTVNPQTKTILLSSVPRDSYVMLHSYNQLDKLTHTGVWGVNETITTIEDWLDIDINYYVRVNFSMLVDIVNAIDGVDVYSDYEFDSAIHDCHYVKGWNHLSGKQALYFARERHAFEDEDQQRIKNQQKVMKACLKKITTSTTILTSYNKLLDAVDDEMETNMSQKEISSIVKMQLNDMSKWKIISQSVQGDLAMKGTYTMGMGRELLVSIPREKSVKKVSKKIHDTMYPIDIK